MTGEPHSWDYWCGPTSTLRYCTRCGMIRSGWGFYFRNAEEFWNDERSMYPFRCADEELDKP